MAIYDNLCRRFMKLSKGVMVSVNYRCAPRAPVPMCLLGSSYAAAASSYNSFYGTWSSTAGSSSSDVATMKKATMMPAASKPELGRAAWCVIPGQICSQVNSPHNQNIHRQPS
jgi:hypothetical protein